jgi:sugar-specific transcriptional regulator TrmB
MGSSEEDIRAALSEVLKMYDIRLEENPIESPAIEGPGDYSEMISKTQTRLDDLNEKAEEIFKRTGMTREQLEAYASNPNNFTKEQWEALQKVKEACDRYKREARNLIVDPKFEQKVETGEHKKQPQRFAKKKHWIPL